MDVSTDLPFFTAQMLAPFPRWHTIVFNWSYGFPGRNKLTVTGVRRVIRCDAEGAAMLTSKGTLELTGAELSVTSLDLDKGEVKLTGRVDTLEYTAEHTPGGFLRRLVR